MLRASQGLPLAQRTSWISLRDYAQGGITESRAVCPTATSAYEYALSQWGKLAWTPTVELLQKADRVCDAEIQSRKAAPPTGIKARSDISPATTGSATASGSTLPAAKQMGLGGSTFVLAALLGTVAYLLTRKGKRGSHA